MSEAPNHNLLTVKETAEYLRIPLPTVYYLVQRGQIPAIQIGGRWRIKKSSLDRDILRQDKQGQPTVLVVDDDPGLQELFKTFLKKIGFSRVVVGTAKDAITSLRKQKFDLMFLDLQLPDAPGDQVYKTAKHIDPDLNVIVMEDYVNPVQRVAGTDRERDDGASAMVRAGTSGSSWTSAATRVSYW